MITHSWLRYVYLIVGLIAVALGVIGIILPIVPTTPFLILALACFSKSSPRLHQWLIRHPWVGPTLQQWQTQRSIPARVKVRAMWLIIVSFSVSILILNGKPYLQAALLFGACILVIGLSRVKTTEAMKGEH